MAKEWARVALRMPFGVGKMNVLMGRNLMIETVPTQHVAIDGEVITRTPIQVSVARNALLLMVPTAYQDRDAAKSGADAGTGELAKLGLDADGSPQSCDASKHGLAQRKS